MNELKYGLIFTEFNKLSNSKLVLFCISSYYKGMIKKVMAVDGIVNLSKSL